MKFARVWSALILDVAAVEILCKISELAIFLILSDSEHLGLNVTALDFWCRGVSHFDLTFTRPRVYGCKLGTRDGRTAHSQCDEFGAGSVVLWTTFHFRSCIAVNHAIWSLSVYLIDGDIFQAPETTHTAISVREGSWARKQWKM